ncbi:MAG: zinc ribbon domain-containing protein [Clostridia bacterium]|nr:zinc ribbon domain-containing protein [Clostridia bacterium]
MDCKVCNTQNVDDAVYCKNCGNRIDGKKVCPTCRKLIDDDTVYCNYCGTRVDGKKVCPACHTVIEDGDFCPKCGTKAKGSRVANVEEGEIVVKNDKWQTIVGTIGTYLLLFAVIISFIFVFLIGFGASVKVTGSATSVDLDQYGLKSEANLYYYFGQVYDELKLIVDNISSGKVVDFVTPSLYIIAVVGTVVAAAALITVTALAIVSIIRLTQKLMGKQVKNAEKYAFATVLCYALFVALLFAQNSASVYYRDTYSSSSLTATSLTATITLNAATKAGIALAAVFASLALACHVAKQGASLAKPNVIVPTILRVGSIALTAVVAGVISTALCTMSAQSTYSKTSISMNIGGWLTMWANYMGADTSKGVGTYVVMVMLMLIQITVITLAIILVLNNASNTVKEKNNSATALTLSITLFIAALVYMVLVIVAIKEPLEVIDDEETKFTFVPAIVGMIFALLNLGVAIAQKVLQSTFNKVEQPVIQSAE